MAGIEVGVPNANVEEEKVIRQNKDEVAGAAVWARHSMLTAVALPAAPRCLKFGTVP
jgi:hypothetical protein